MDVLEVFQELFKDIPNFEQQMEVLSLLNREVTQAEHYLQAMETKPSGQAHVTFGREELFDLDPIAPQRSKLMHGTETLNKASESIARSTRVAVEVEQIGGEIIEDLGDQRESLIRTRDRLKDVDQDLSKSKRILNSMAIRIATNKIILLCIIVVELAILGAVVYIKFFQKKKPS
ncbi:vesicle transport through interaction with t-SNAREs homolog 1B-like isoform X4 [Acropora palmata]|uniref:vesicle transport through interaction with t-SNAREs homolog 1B-like isoform X4 n=1 Tax=Acropora palmata TaxID=6131 RepID=UPI003DA0122D